MQFESGKEISKLIAELIAAKKRGVDVVLRLDPYSNQFTRVGNRDVWKYSQIVRNPIEPRSGVDERTLKRRNRHLTDYNLKKLEALGILEQSPSSGILEKLKVVGGGNHRKFAVVDDVAWLGTTNLTDSDILGMDNFMIKSNSPEFVGVLGNIFLQPPDVDSRYVSSDGWELLVDAGIPKSSIVYARALEMIGQAKERIEFVTQYWPAGVLKDALIRRAREGLDVKVFMQSLGDHRIWRFPFNIEFTRFFMGVRSSGLQLVFPPRPTHAKGLVVDGQAALFGSSNLFKPAISMGVREISLYTEDPLLVGQIEERIFNHS